MSIDTQAIIKQYQSGEGDTGSTNVQVALLTARIQLYTCFAINPRVNDVILVNKSLTFWAGFKTTMNP
jgi:ribosomal protein S15